MGLGGLLLALGVGVLGGGNAAANSAVVAGDLLLGSSDLPAGPHAPAGGKTVRTLA